MISLKQLKSMDTPPAHTQPILSPVCTSEVVNISLIPKALCACKNGTFTTCSHKTTLSTAYGDGPSFLRLWLYILFLTSYMSNVKIESVWMSRNCTSPQEPGRWRPSGWHSYGTE
jgi:hypothetical protein